MFQSTPLREGRLHRNISPNSKGSFQSTPLREGRHNILCPLYQQNLCFNPRPSARGDKIFGTLHPLVGRFQSTPLREGRPKSFNSKDGAWSFNPRPSARGDAAKMATLFGGSKFQSTPLREGRLRRSPSCCILARVSIHAPPRGATFLRPMGFGTWGVSIHAPPRGATTHSHSLLWVFSVSIHAPPRGATLASPRKRASILFQSTPLREGRL